MGAHVEGTSGLHRVIRFMWHSKPYTWLLVATTVFCAGCPDSTPTGSSTDADSDGVANAADNCPATANADQSDANGNGFGDACEYVTGSHYAILTAHGVVEVLLDECRRPTRMVDAQGAYTLAWSDEGRQVTATAQTANEELRETVSLDWSEAALLEIFADLEAQTGVDQSNRRHWLAADPDGVAQSAACIGAETGKWQITAQWQPPPRPPPGGFETMGDYLRFLNEQGDYWAGLWISWVDRLHQVHGGGIPMLWQRMLDHFQEMERRALNELVEEQRDCLPCTPACDIDCSQFGACYRNGRCDERTQADCDDVGGEFFPGTTCDYGCCATAEGVTVCENMPIANCLQIDADDSASAHHLFPRLCESYDNPCP